MSDSFESKPQDGYHGSTPWTHDKSDWRGWGDGLVSYGNYAGPDNRYGKLSPEEQAKTDPASIKPIDGMDALAQQHDQGYGDAGIGTGPGKHSMWSWDGIRATHGADKALVQGTAAEMAAHGGEYSGSAQQYSRAMRGLFAGRYKTVEAADWMGRKGGEARDGLNGAWDGTQSFVGNKAKEAGAGLGGFVQDARGWRSPGEAWSGARQGVSGATGWLNGSAKEAAGGFKQGLDNGAGWLKGTAQEGWKGAKSTFDTFRGLGKTGMATGVLGAGEALGAGAVHAGSEAMGTAKKKATSLWHKVTPWSD